MTMGRLYRVEPLEPTITVREPEPKPDLPGWCHVVITVACIAAVWALAIVPRIRF